MSSGELLIGFVVIGRNEGARLESCLQSVLAQSSRVVYADSSSDDGSVQTAQRLGAATVIVGRTGPLSAARGRNVGYAALRERFSECEFVQFIDGDCVLLPGWTAVATSFLRENNDVAVVCGRRFEVNPKASIYNWLMDREWKTELGATEACGGDSMVRVAAFEQVGGFNSNLTAGEEPELCARFRAKGWKIWRLDAPMTEHDANIHQFGGWWRRAKRSGYGYAQVWSATRTRPKRLYGRELRRTVIWSMGLPLLLVSLAIALGSPWLLLMLPVIYFLQIGRLAIREGAESGRSWSVASLVVITKFAEGLGVLSYLFRANPTPRFDYKPSSPAGKNLRK